MSFDKIKAMKNAERFLSQGKLRSAIGEYKKVIDENPKDFSTLNIMGDLYVKNSESKEAVNCYRQVGEHYYSQGFANKAIAIYNKIARLQPDLMEIAQRLAQLYQMRGSYAEAREQYTKLAESYQSKGMKLEALEIWKRIAELDPNNTEVYMTIGKACVQENQNAEAVDAFAEAGLRFNAQEKFDAAVGAFSKALLIQSNSIKTLKGFVAAKIGLGCADEAAVTLEKVLSDNPYSREILLLLTDCYIEMNAPQNAEETVIKLVQQEPSHFPKFLEVVKVYMKDNDLESSVRVLSISFEHILGAGLASEFIGWINEVLARNPEYIEGLRLLVKYHSWHRDPVEIRKSLERLAETARMNESVEDERFALGQLASISPLQTEYSERLDELKQKYGFEESNVPVEEFSVVPEFESFIALNSDDDGDIESGELVGGLGQYETDINFSGDGTEFLNVADDSEVITDFSFTCETLEPNYGEIVSDEVVNHEPNFASTVEAPKNELSLSDERKLQTEVESIEFYINQGYNDLALQCLDALIVEFGEIPKLRELRLCINGSDEQTLAVEPQIDAEQVTEFEYHQEEEAIPLAEVYPEADSEQNVEFLVDSSPSDQIDEFANSPVDVFEQFRNDLGLEEFEEDSGGDYSTLYQTAIAYKEMGLMEDAIKEFQDAINMVEINDGTRRYFQCANLVGHCFMMKGMPNLAQTWFKRALETEGLKDEEIQALNYELANAYELSGEKDKAYQYFEQVYALDVDYRDIVQRIQNLRENYSSSMIN